MYSHGFERLPRKYVRFRDLPNVMLQTLFELPEDRETHVTSVRWAGEGPFLAIGFSDGQIKVRYRLLFLATKLVILLSGSPNSYLLSGIH